MCCGVTNNFIDIIYSSYQVYTVATHVLLALAVVLGAACNRTWNLTALQVFQVEPD